MKRLLLLIAALTIMFTACIPLKVVVPTDLCVKYAVSWAEPCPPNSVCAVPAIPARDICICTEDIYTGLAQTLGTMAAEPLTIELKGVMSKEECEKILGSSQKVDQ